MMKTNFDELRKKMKIDLGREGMDKVVYFKLSAKDYSEYKLMLIAIREQTANKKPIEQTILDKLDLLFVPLQGQFNEERSAVTDERIRIVKEKFKNYDFLIIGNFGFNYTLDHMIHNAVEVTLLTMLMEETDKRDCIYTCYRNLCLYRDVFLNEETKKKLGHYFMTAMAGYITLLLGQKISKEFTPEILKTDPSIESIYKAIYKTTDKIKCKGT